MGARGSVTLLVSHSRKTQSCPDVAAAPLVSRASMAARLWSRPSGGVLAPWLAPNPFLRIFTEGWWGLKCRSGSHPSAGTAPWQLLTNLCQSCCDLALASPSYSTVLVVAWPCRESAEPARKPPMFFPGVALLQRQRPEPAHP